MSKSASLSLKVNVTSNITSHDAKSGVHHRVKPLNSLLFVPASRPDRIAKAMLTGADAVIVDLEDSVAFHHKDVARTALKSILNANSPVMLRINSADSPWFKSDLEMLSCPGISAVVLPKAENPDDILSVSRASRLPVLPLIETAIGFQRLQALANSLGVSRLIFGHIDLQADLDMRAEEDELLPFRVSMVLASRLANIASPIDGVTTAITDTYQLRNDALRARRLGFGGKLCIHPSQVTLVNECFTPTFVEVAWANRVLNALDKGNAGIAVVDGKMVDRPVLLRAQRILDEAQARDAFTSSA